jgi:predicted RNase H-related nuclease YkuK (DUF458 family)
MWTCKYCTKEFEYISISEKANHSRWCTLNPKRNSYVLIDREVEVHLDINPSEMYGSNCVMNEAIDYIRGTCNVIPMIKPKAFAASYAADRLKEVMNAD